MVPHWESVWLHQGIPFFPFLSVSFPSLPSLSFLSFHSLPKMISDVTPRMLAAINQMDHDESMALEAAILADNDELCMQLMAAKDVAVLFEDSPFAKLMQLMDRTDLLWGDIMLAQPQVKEVKSKSRILELDEDWVMPTLRLRKHIWENFPVNVIPIESKDKRERYAIQWHNKKFQEAREACEHGWEYMDFEEDTYRRLIKSLTASRYWTVEEAVGIHDLCTIAMNFSDEEKPSKAFILPSNKLDDSDAEDTEDAKSVTSVASEVTTTTAVSQDWEEVSPKKAMNTVPQLRRLNDIKNHFPVIWSEVVGCKSTTYAVEIFGKKAKEQGLNIIKVKADLLAALKASRSWTVLPATNERQVCLLQMNFLPA